VAFFYFENDEDYSSNFLMENRVGVLSLVFAAFAIFISCLGYSDWHPSQPNSVPGDWHS
jgi:hypothetical protein